MFAVTVAAFTGAGLVAGLAGGPELYQSVVGVVSGMVVAAVGAAFLVVPVAIVARALGLRSRTFQRGRAIVSPYIGLVFAGLFLSMFVLFVIGSATGWIPPGAPCTADCGDGGGGD